MAVQERSSDHDRTRARCGRLEDVLAASDSTVRPDIRAATDRIDDRRQRCDCAERAVQLTFAVIAHDDGIDAQ